MLGIFLLNMLSWFLFYIISNTFSSRRCEIPWPSYAFLVDVSFHHLSIPCLLLAVLLISLAFHYTSLCMDTCYVHFFIFTYNDSFLPASSASVLSICLPVSVRQGNFIYKCMSCLIQIKKVDSYNILHGWIKWAFFCVVPKGKCFHIPFPLIFSVEWFEKGKKKEKIKQGLTVGIKYCLTLAASIISFSLSDV